MKYVWQLRVEHQGFSVRTLIVDMLYLSETDAESHADLYRESVETYNVSVKKREVL